MNCCTTALYPCASCWADDVFNKSQVNRLTRARLRGYGGLIPALPPRLRAKPAKVVTHG